MQFINRERSTDVETDDVAIVWNASPTIIAHGLSIPGMSLGGKRNMVQLIAKLFHIPMGEFNPDYF